MVKAELLEASRTTLEEADKLALQLRESMEGTLFNSYPPLIRGILYSRFYRRLGEADYSVVLKAYYDHHSPIVESPDFLDD